MSDLLAHGLGFHLSLAMLVLRFPLGIFFTISGFHKLFNKGRHAAIVATMTADHVPLPWFNCWFVPLVEFFGGMSLLVGLLTPLAALGLLCVCTVATMVDGLRRVNRWIPIDKADYCDDLLYLPEVLYSIMLLPIIFCGAGAYSIDALLYRLLATTI